MLSMMPLLSVYWPYLLTSVLVYVVYVLVFDHNRSTPEKQTVNPIKSSSKEVKKDNYSSKDDIEEDGEDEVQPLTFPEDTPHVPYIFNEISAVRSMFRSRNVQASNVIYKCNKVNMFILIRQSQSIAQKNSTN